MNKIVPMIQEKRFSREEAGLLMHLNKNSHNIMQELKHISMGGSDRLVALSSEGYTIDDLILMASEMLLKISNYKRG